MNRGIAGWGMAAVLMLPGVAGATLIDRGDGLIYDDVLDITWLQDANYAKTSGHDADGQMNWADAVAWADGLVYEGYDDWRLPTLSPIDGSSIFDTDFSNNATTDLGYAKTTTDGSDGGWRDGAGDPVSEMGYMYYVNLGNLGFCTPNDSSPTSCTGQTGYGLTNAGLFDNLQSGNYWSGLEYAPNPSDAWNFDFNNGIQNAFSKGHELFAWAVRPGDVAAAPEPGTALLMALGLAGLLGFGHGKRRHSALR